MTEHPLLATISQRISALDKPAYVKNSALVYVAVNDAYAALFSLTPDDIVGATTGELAVSAERLDLEDRERRAIVFGEDQIAPYADPYGAGRFQVEIERFSTDDEHFYLFGVFEPLAGPLNVAPQAPSEATGPEPARMPVPPHHHHPERAHGLDPSELFDALDAGVIIYGADDRVVYANRKVQDFYEKLIGPILPGQSRRDILGRVFDHGAIISDENEPDDRAAWIERRHAEASSDDTIHLNRMADGRYIRIINRRLATGGLLSVRFDVTDFKEREKEIGLYRSLLDNLPVAAYVRGADHRLVYANAAYSALTGVPQDRLIGTEETDIFGLDGIDLKRDNARLLADGVPIKDEQELEIPDRRLVNVLSNVARLETEDGHRYIVGSLTDISAIRKLDRQVVEANIEAERAFRLAEDATNTIPNGLVVVNGESIVLSNAAAPQLLDLDAQLFRSGQSWEPLYRETCRRGGLTDLAEIDRSVARFRVALTGLKALDYRFPLDNDRWFRLQALPDRNGDMVLLYTELTELIRREAELKTLVERAESADRAKSEFLANMSHEIRTPMNGILGMAELLSRTALDTRQKTFIDIVMKSGNALMTIINDILDFSRIDAGELSLRSQPFDPGEAVEDIAGLMHARAAEKDIELIVRREAGLPDAVLGDAGRFRQILTNLVANAVKFTERGHVLVSVGAGRDGKDRESLIVRVEDTGAGIAPQRLPTIFDKFADIDGTQARRHEGSGLGLAITKGLVNLFDGTIDVESERGKGTVFTVTLPLPAHGEKSRQRALPVNVEGARIVIIDDNDVNRTILAEQLAEWRFDAVAVDTGAAGHDLLAAAHADGLEVDAIILDCDMPQENGIDFARRLRSDPRFAGIAIILLTTMESASDDAVFRSLDIAAHLMKPARAQLLRDTLIDVVRLSRSARGVDSAPKIDRRSSVVAMTPSLPPLARAAVSNDDTVPAFVAAIEAAPLPSEPPQIPASSVGLTIEGDPIFGSFADLLETQPSLADVGRPSGLDVLIAEDNEVNQIVFRQILDGSGISFHIVDNGERAVGAWQDQNPSIILMDISMPVMDGLAAARRIREIEAETGGHVPIVGVTARVSEADRDACFAAGMDDTMSKPISPERLEAKIEQWVKAGRAGVSSA